MSAIPYVREGTLVFDVGGNIGHKTQMFLDAGCKVVVFEPIPENQKILRDKFGDKITLEPIALGGGRGETHIYICRDVNGMPLFELSSMERKFMERTRQGRFNCFHYNDADYKKVPVDCLDNMIEKHGEPDFIKIDVEGYEFSVLAGLHRAIRAISFEFTPELFDSAVMCVKQLVTIYREYSFNYSSGESRALDFKDPVSFWEILAHVGLKKDYVKEFGDIYAVRQI